MVVYMCVCKYGPLNVCMYECMHTNIYLVISYLSLLLFSETAANAFADLKAMYEQRSEAMAEYTEVDLLYVCMYVQLNTCRHTFFLPALNDWSRFCEESIKTIFIINHSLVHTYTCYIFIHSYMHTHVYYGNIFYKTFYITIHTYMHRVIFTCTWSFSRQDGWISRIIQS